MNTIEHGSPALAEADRLMTVCNSCRYCEGLCAVFPAMEARRAFADADLDYLANLCHACGACHADCQYAPPHEFNVNVPRVLADVREESYARYVWPKAFAPLFARNGLAVALALALSVAAFIAGFVAIGDPQALWAAGSEPGAFYRVMPHNTMAGLFGLAGAYSLAALTFSLFKFWRETGAASAGAFDWPSLWQATKDAARLRYLDGGGAGCTVDTTGTPDRRRIAHHATFYGFLLCAAATAVATVYHFILGREAPYPWWDIPVVLGTFGGIGLIIGPIGLLHMRQSRSPLLTGTRQTGMDTGFLAMLVLVAASGLALLVLRATPAMGLLLAFHLGTVFSLFVTMPYGKFVHGLYRFMSLVRYSHEMRLMRS
ncbi:MAG: tricarballylate utilization 4Fe-4S protein TcuB [Rhodospirillales bacterium]|nr:tricarballylate utilization 4Fe-4S protein TcuB [Rhodospirillales bacterium]